MVDGIPERALIGRLAQQVHARVSRGPPWMVRGYFAIISWFSRNLLPRGAQRRVLSSMRGGTWPALAFDPYRIVLGRETQVRLIPHLGEFDEQALYSKRLDYEPAVFDWLERCAADYDLVIQIGANVGVYSVFLDALARRRPQDGRLRVVAFEPSGEAYRRLQANLAANGTRSVTSFQAAIGTSSGLRAFYEPAGHLTNGSFVRSFAEHFSSDIEESVVVAVSAQELERWLGRSRNALVKIDVEGFEPQLLEALGALIETYRPDLLIEVLPGTPEALAGNRALSGYDRFLITGEGPRKEEKLYFSQQHFDWLLSWPRAASSPVRR